MSQLACPLCGRFVSLSGFDPSNFDSDIYAVNRTGLGRGRGFAVSESFSVLGDLTITGLIASRCSRILGMIEGREIPSSNDVSVMKVEIERLKAEDFRKKRAQQDLYAQLTDLERQAIYWKNEATRLLRVQKDSWAVRAGFEAEVDKLKRMVERLRNENRRLESLRNEMGSDADDEGELLAMEEMETILDKINTSANTTLSISMMLFLIFLKGINPYRESKVVYVSNLFFSVFRHLVKWFFFNVYHSSVEHFLAVRALILID